MTTEKIATPSDRVLVLFGATGDLAGRKLCRACFTLYASRDDADAVQDHRLRASSPGAEDDFRTAHVARRRAILAAGARRSLGGVRGDG